MLALLQCSLLLLHLSLIVIKRKYSTLLIFLLKIFSLAKDNVIIAINR